MHKVASSLSLSRHLDCNLSNKILYSKFQNFVLFGGRVAILKVVDVL